MTFGQVLRSLRQESKLTQKELANIFKISESTIGMYERDQREPSFEMQEAFADYFNVDMDYLMGRSDTRRMNSYPDIPLQDDPHEIRMIARAGKKMSPEKRAEMLRVLKAIFPEEFEE